VSASSWTCPVCNTANDRATARCIVCGLARPEAAARTAAANADGAGPGRRILWLVAAMAGVVVLAAIAWFAFGRGDGGSDGPTTTDPAATTSTTRPGTKDVRVAFLYPTANYADALDAMGAVADRGYLSGSRTALSPTPATSTVYYLGDHRADARTIARTLGLPATSVLALPQPFDAPIAADDDIVVVLGADWLATTG
jgi:hypothetical protein